MKKHGFICEINFFKSFFADYRISENSFESRGRERNWWSLFEGILNSRLSFDCDWATLYGFIVDDVTNYYSSNLNSCLSFRLIKSLMDKGALDVKSNKELPDSVSNSYLSEDELLSTFLIDDVSKISVGEALGVQVITTDSYLLSNDYNRMPKEISQHVGFSWESILDNIPNQNSALIMDRYIACTPSDIRNNLFPIIDVLLPDYLGIPFHLSIMTLEHSEFDHYKFYPSDFAPEKFSPRDLDNMSYGQKLFYIVEKYIKSKKANLEFQLSVYMCDSRSFHDRIILTNSMFVSSGAGFNLRRWDHRSKQIVSSTDTIIDISIIGICSERDRIKSNHYYDMAKNIAQNITPIKGFRNGVNRLFIS